MPFEWPDAEQMTYRLWRLRRLWALCVLLPAAVIMASGVPPVLGSVAILAVACLVTLHICLLPNVAHETLALSLSLTGLVVVLPWVQGLAGVVPVEHAQAALMLATALAVGGAVVVMALLGQVIRVLVHLGPAVRLRLQSQTDLPCSAAVAQRHYALQPQTRRGRILTGQADAQGMFEVAVASAQMADPAHPDQPLVVRVAAKVLQAEPGLHDVLLVLPCGAVTVTALRFQTAASGCRVTVSDMPGDFTLGMYLQYWLTDQQGDALQETADIITGAGERANGLAHGASFLSLAGLVLSPSAPLADRAK
ncbi:MULTISPECIES: hypothetical protein [unclassified Yoonia]|uniref:hypothetical protein n=1 Tax=unclassified Yoonia TaxID=2629118 RepID=UPI002AFFD347|nr:MULTISPECIES: hypothetical protein [unclassified Yoonia]